MEPLYIVAAKRTPIGSFNGLLSPQSAPELGATAMRVAINQCQLDPSLIGIGEMPDEHSIDPDLVNAGGQPITATTGACYFNSADSFIIIRGGHVDVTVLGALQVDLIITELGVIKLTDRGMELVEIAPETTIDEIQAATEAPLFISPSHIFPVKTNKASR